MSDLPEGWAWATPPEIADRRAHSLGIGPFGSDLQVSDYREDGTPLVFVRNIRAESFGGEGDRFISAGKAADLNAHKVLPGDLLITKMGDPPGDACLYPLGRPPAVMTADCIRLRPNADLCEAKFLMYAARANLVRRQVLVRTTGVAQKKVSLERFASVRFPVAPPPEQRRIVEALDSYLTRLDAAAEGLRRVEANLKRYRASVLKSAVEGRLVPTEAELAKREGRAYEPASELLARILKERRRRWEAAELAKMKAKGESPKTDTWKSKYHPPTAPDTTNLPALPEGWCWATVEAVGDVLLGRQRAPQYLTGRHAKPYLRVANVKDDRLDCSDLEEMDFDLSHFEKYRLRADDILVSEGQSPELVGQSAIYPGGIPNLCFQKTLHRFRPVPGGPSAQFSQLVFCSHVKSGVFMRLASITTNIAHLTLERFESAPFPLAPAKEQERIVEEAGRQLSKANALGTIARSQLVRLQRLRQSILTWAFEGKLVDQDPNDEPASALLDRIRAQRIAAEAAPKPGKPRRPTRARKGS